MCWPKPQLVARTPGWVVLSLFVLIGAVLGMFVAGFSLTGRVAELEQAYKPKVALWAEVISIEVPGSQRRLLMKGLDLPNLHDLPDVGNQGGKERPAERKGGKG